MSALTVTEARRLEACEDDIEKGGAMMTASLKVIHDEKLYRQSHSTFELYCEVRWGMSRSNAYRILQHRRVLEMLSDDPKMSPIGDKIPEAATREVSDLPSEKQVEILTQASGGGKKTPTAREVKETRQKLSPKEPSRQEQIQNHFDGKTYNDSFNPGELEGKTGRADLIKQIEVKSRAVSRQTQAAVNAFGETAQSRAIFKALETIKRAVAEWAQ